MSTTHFKGAPVQLNGTLPFTGIQAPDFTLVQSDLSELSLMELRGKRVILNIFPSIDTGVCAMSVRAFNKEAAQLDNMVVLCISKDLPFAAGRFCAAEGIDKVKTLSVFRNSHFEKDYGVLLADGPLKGLLARAVVVINESGEVIYSELVDEITLEPNYQAALAVL